MQKLFKTMNAMKNRNPDRGFTLIEVMIAMAIFTIVVTIGMGAVLDAISEHYAVQNTRTVMDNLNFIMDDMARNIRLGYELHCELAGDPAYVDTSTGDITQQSCPGGSNKIVFRDLTGAENLTYVFSRPDALVNPNQILKEKDTIGSAGLTYGTAEDITPPEVKIDFAHSGFTVRGAEYGDGAQPSVTIRMAGTISYNNTTSTFNLQTTVTLRSLDN